jgi:hypothetical protein
MNFFNLQKEKKDTPLDQKAFDEAMGDLLGAPNMGEAMGDLLVTPTMGKQIDLLWNLRSLSSPSLHLTQVAEGRK